ncbi:GpE family phage tail protein [Escherichia coli]
MADIAVIFHWPLAYYREGDR